MDAISDGVGEQYAALRERYDSLVMERWHAMRAGPRFATLQSRWLGRLKHAHPYSTLDFWLKAEGRLKEKDIDTWQIMQLEVAELSESYGIAPWHVLWSLFIRDYDPLDPKGPGFQFVLDAWYEQARLVVLFADPDILEDLVKLGARAGVFVELRHSSEEGDDSRSGRGPDSYLISLEVPLELPPNLAVKQSRGALRTCRQMLRDAGVPVSLRSRSIPATSPVEAALITHSATDPFVERLRTACDDLGLLLQVEPGQPSSAPLDSPGKVGLALVRLRLEFAVDIRSDALVLAVRKAIRLSRVALKAAGLDLGERLRTSPLVQRAIDLQVDGTVLGTGGLGNLVEDIYGVFPKRGEGPALRARIKSRKHRAGKRIRRKGLLPPD